MSRPLQCDNCGALLPEDSDELSNWIKVVWGWGGRRDVGSDYCTTACAVAGMERARDEDAENAMAALEGDGRGP